MLQQIINDFEKECEKNPDDMTLRIICNHVTEKLQYANENVLKNIINNELTLNRAVKTMSDEARKRTSGNYAVLSDTEGFKIVDGYFGIENSGSSEDKPSKTVSLFDMI